MQFGMPTLIENRTLADNVALCRRLGLRFIELNMNFPEYQVDRLEQTDALVAAAVAAGVYYTIHLDENLNVADFNPLVSGAYLETVRRTILVAKALLPLKDRFGDSAQPLTVNMHMHHGIYITLPDRKVQMYDRDFDTYMRAFGSFRALCEEWIGDSDVRIVIENTDGFRPYEQKAIEYLLESPVSASPGTSVIPRPSMKRTCLSFWPTRTGSFISTSMTGRRPRPETISLWAMERSTSPTGSGWPRAETPVASWRPRP